MWLLESINDAWNVSKLGLKIIEQGNEVGFGYEITKFSYSVQWLFLESAHQFSLVLQQASKTF